MYNENVVLTGRAVTVTTNRHALTLVLAPAPMPELFELAAAPEPASVTCVEIQTAVLKTGKGPGMRGGMIPSPTGAMNVSGGGSATVGAASRPCTKYFAITARLRARSLMNSTSASCFESCATGHASE